MQGMGWSYLGGATSGRRSIRLQNADRPGRGSRCRTLHRRGGVARLGFFSPPRHPLDDAGPEGGKAPGRPRCACPPKFQLRLGAEFETKKAALRRVGPAARQWKLPIKVLQAGHARAFRGIAGKHPARLNGFSWSMGWTWISTSLPYRIVRRHRAIDEPRRRNTFRQISQEIRGLVIGACAASTSTVILPSSVSKTTNRPFRRGLGKTKRAGEKPGHADTSQDSGQTGKLFISRMLALLNEGQRIVPTTLRSRDDNSRRPLPA